MKLTVRRGRPDDAEACGRICFDAFAAISEHHNFPPDFPSPDVALGLVTMLLSRPDVYAVVAEEEGRIVGSNFLWKDLPIAAVGPVSVELGAQNRAVGRSLMDDVLAHARECGAAGVRLVQSTFHVRSLVLYAKLGFEVREPLVCLQGPPIRHPTPGHEVRAATEEDTEACNALCRQVHGHERSLALREAIRQGTARIVEHGRRITGYATDIGFLGHAVALSNSDLKALIAAAERISGPGLLLPARNGELFRWCVRSGLRVVQPMTLMSTGLYNEPAGAFLPSILY